FPHRRAWRDSVVVGRRTSDFISTEAEKGVTCIKLHQDLGKDYKGGGRPRSHVAERLTRTVLSDAKAADSRTAALARTEMQSGRLPQLEPSGPRRPASFLAPRSIAANGAHMPATLARLTRTHRAAAVTARVANRLAELIDGVQSVRVDADERRD